MALPISLVRTVDTIQFHLQKEMLTTEEAAVRLLHSFVDYFSEQAVRDALARVSEPLRAAVKAKIANLSASGFDERRGYLGPAPSPQQQESMFEQQRRNYQEIARLVNELFVH